MNASRRPDEEGEEPPRPGRRLHPARRVALGTAGAVLMLIGAVLLVLPGPGLLLVFAGLVLFARAVPAVARFVAPVRIRALQGVEASVASPARIAGTLLMGLALIGAGVVWGTRPVAGLPFAGWSTGSSLILSGVIVLGLLAWSHRRVHGSGPRPGHLPGGTRGPRA